MDDRVGPRWLTPGLGALLVVVGLLTVAIRTGAVVEAQALLGRELKRASLERRERALAQGLQQRWHRLGPDAPAGKAARP
ncbi:MAG TPA: hypothetical protein VFD43_01265 [Planctomycetota bacterium]|nr:hypothetical protein [Planctomycetota bacterium]